MTDTDNIQHDRYVKYFYTYMSEQIYYQNAVNPQTLFGMPFKITYSIKFT